MARDHLIPKTDTQQFEVIRPKYVGLDVHKKSVVSAVCTSDPVTLTASYKTSVFNTTTSDIATLRDWLLTQDCHDVCMESTGKYWIPIFNILEPHFHSACRYPGPARIVPLSFNTFLHAHCGKEPLPEQHDDFPYPDRLRPDRPFQPFCHTDHGLSAFRRALYAVPSSTTG